MAKPIAPGTKASAISQGFTPINALSDFVGDTDAKLSHAFEAHLGPPVDCRQSPPGTLCFDRYYPGQGHVVGYCDGNGQCHLVAKPG